MTAYTSHPGILYYLPHINILRILPTDTPNHKAEPITWLTDDDWPRVRKWEAETFTLLRTNRQMIPWDDESRGVVDRMGDREGWPSGVECRSWSTVGFYSDSDFESDVVWWSWVWCDPCILIDRFLMIYDLIENRPFVFLGLRFAYNIVYNGMGWDMYERDMSYSYARMSIMLRVASTR